MSGNNYVRSGFVERLPYPIHLTAVAGESRAKARKMPVGERATSAVDGKVCAEPLLLQGARVHGRAAVQNDNVPRPQLVTVVPLRRVSCCLTEVAEVACRTGRHVVVVAWGWPCAPLVLTPRGVVTLIELSDGARIVDVV